MLRTVILFCLLTVSWPLPVAAQPTEISAEVRARQIFDEAMKLYNTGQYRQAIAKLIAAQAMNEHKNHLYRLSRCHQALGEMRLAFEYSQKYIRQLPVAKQPGTLRQAEKRLRWDPLCKLSIFSVPSGAAVFVGGKLRGTTPAGRALVLSLPGGTSKIEVRKEGFKSGLWAPSLQFGEPRSKAFLLHEHRGTLRVKSNISGTGISLAGYGLGESLYPDGTNTTASIGVAPLWREMSSGRHLIQADAAGYVPKRRWVTLAPGETKEVQFVFKPGDKIPSTPNPTPSPSANKIFFDVLFGPAHVDYGDPVLATGWNLELSGGGGYLWRLGSWGLYARGSLHYAPSQDLSNGASSGAFIMALAGGGGRLYPRPWLWLDVSAALGLSVLVGVNEESMFFALPHPNPKPGGDLYLTPDSYTGGGFESLAFRSRIGVGFTLRRGATVALYPFALDYCTRNRHFRDSMTKILRYNIAVAVGGQL